VLIEMDRGKKRESGLDYRLEWALIELLYLDFVILWKFNDSLDPQNRSPGITDRSGQGRRDWKTAKEAEFRMRSAIA
jgi:hypothetical protein